MMQPQGTDRLPVRLYLNQSMLRIDMASHKQDQLFKLEGEKQNTHLPLPFFHTFPSSTSTQFPLCPKIVMLPKDQNLNTEVILEGWFRIHFLGSVSD